MDIRKAVIESSSVPFGVPLSYSELCFVFNIERQRGSKLQKQMRNLTKEYDIKKEGRMYTILKKFTEQDKLELLHHDNIKSHVEMLICTLLTYPSVVSSRKLDMRELLELLRIVNKDYCVTKYGDNKRYATDLLDIEDINYDNISIFLNETEPMLKRIVRESLLNLQDKQILLVKLHTVIVKKIYNSKGKWIDIDPYELTKEWEEVAFLECKNEVLKDMGCTKETQIFARGELVKKQYRDEVARRLGGDYYHNRYELIINTKHIDEHTIQNEAERKKIESICNKLVKNKLMNSKQGKLKTLSEDYKQIYINTFVDSSIDNRFRYKYKELQKMEEENGEI